MSTPLAIVALLCLAADPRTDLDASGEESVWGLELRLGGGLDSNVLRDPKAERQAVLAQSNGRGTLAIGRDLSIELSGSFQQNAEVSALREIGGEAYVSYRRPIVGDLGFQLSSLSAYRRDVSVFADGLALSTGGRLSNDLAQNLLVSFEYGVGTVDLELGARGEARRTWGNETATRLGASALATLRWIPIMGLSLRLRYAHAWRMTRGLTIRNRLGGYAGIVGTIPLESRSLGFTVRAQVADALEIFAEAQRSYYIRDLTGYYVGLGDRVQASARLRLASSVVLEAGGAIHGRAYAQRVASLDNVDAEHGVEAFADVRIWIFEGLGLFGRYELERTSASPVGVLFTRHIGLVGVCGRLGREG